MAVGKNKRISKGKKGGKKKAADPFAKKDWYDIKAPSCFRVRNVGKTLVTRTQGTKIASEGLKHRVFEVSLGDLLNEEEHAYRKIRLRAEDVQGKNVLTNFWGMNFTTDKLRSLVRKWHTLIEAYVDVKTTDNFTLRLFCIGFTKRLPNQVKRTCYAQTSQIRQIRRKMREIMVAQAASCDLKSLVEKFIAEVIGREIEKATSSIYPLQNVFIAEVIGREIEKGGVDMEGCLQARNLLQKKLRYLEKKAYTLAGMKFSLYTAADIANVLYGHLKLPIPEGHNKGKQHPSTDKHCLDLLRHEHPIVPVIKEHRTLAKLLNCTLGSICSLARISMSTQKYTLHGHWLQTSTATGRLSMEEPNLQCVEHMVEFKMSNEDIYGGNAEVDHCKINARDFFIPSQENWILLAADYSQIELRLMAHFSKDPALIGLLSKPHGDVFTMIAARWTGRSEDSVGSQERDQTKRLIYGILYGMGPNTLSEQLNCSSNEAKEKIKSFKSSFPGVASWLHVAVSSCRQKGYVETLKGRKRFLSKIKFGNNKEKSKAQRQAVNSICQGSAADIIKIAMINIHSIIVGGVYKPDSSLAANFQMLKGRCRLLLQVHDELVLEVDPSVIKEAVSLVQKCMESAALLLVPLLVKIQVGSTWGSLEPFQADNYTNVVPDL